MSSTDTGRFEEVQRGVGRDESRPRTLLPDPDPRPHTYRLVSVDDHVLETPGTFVDRVPSSLADRVPRIVEADDGCPYWLVEGELEHIANWNVAAGRPMEEWDVEPARYEELRAGGYDVHSRVLDMDLAGIDVSLNFPSGVWGFAGNRFLRMQDAEVAQACIRAWNDWVYEEWWSEYPDRFLLSGIVWLGDPEVAAAEVRRNAERGFTSMSMNENPEKLGLPSIHTDHWEPLFRACEETGTAINLHVGSSSDIVQPSSDSPPDVPLALFGLNAAMASMDWLYAKIPVRYPGIRIVLSESGIGWVPMLMDRIEYTFKYRDYRLLAPTWAGVEPSPVDVLRRNFWFTSLWDPSAFRVLDRIGSDRVMMEVDYPHPDTTWPDTQYGLEEQLRDLPEEDVQRVTHGNAEHVYRYQHRG